MTHVPELSLSPEQLSLPNQPFFSWLRSHTTLFVGQIVAALSSVSFISALIYYATEAAGKTAGKDEGKAELSLILQKINVLVDYAHLIFIIVFILVLIHVLNDNFRGAYRVRLVHDRVFGPRATEPSLDGTQEQLRKFKCYFLAFWCLMLVLYITFSIQHSFQLISPPKSDDSVLQSIAALARKVGDTLPHFCFQ